LAIVTLGIGTEGQQHTINGTFDGRFARFHIRFTGPRASCQQFNMAGDGKMLKRTIQIAKKGLLGLLLGLLLLAACGYAYYVRLDLDSIPRPDPATTRAQLPYLSGASAVQRGRILAVVSSAERGGPGNKKAGYELTEMSRAYYVFQANGYQVDIASPKGGMPPARIDADDMGEYDYAFLNDAQAAAALAKTKKLADIDPTRYAAVFVVGGKGVMFDLAGNADMARIASGIAARGGVVGAVCHGPAALLGVRLADGSELFAGKRMTGFSNAEELFMVKDARTRFPFLLEDRARQLGAHYSAAPLFLNHTVVDGRLVTGQNPWSTWSTAEAMMAALGHAPRPRLRTDEERSVQLLATYHRSGLAAARREQASLARFDKMLLLMHALVAAMEWRLADAFQLQRLAQP
jgi:putative intracellular protease/amidase